MGQVINFSLDKERYSNDEILILDKVSSRLSAEEKSQLDLLKENYAELRSRLNFKIESHAFSMQDQLLSELRSSIACFETYIEEHKKLNGFKMQWETTPDYIFNLYPYIQRKHIETTND